MEIYTDMDAETDSQMLQQQDKEQEQPEEEAEAEAEAEEEETALACLADAAAEADFAEPRDATVRQLQKVFEGADSLPRLRRSLWDAAAGRGISLARVSQCLIAALDADTDAGRCGSAAHAFVGILHAPACPIYTFVTPLAFMAFLRSLKSALRLRSRFSSSANKDADAEDSDSAHRSSSDVVVQDVLRLLQRLQTALRLLLQLRGQPESLKALVFFLTQLPNLVADALADNNSNSNSNSNGVKSRRKGAGESAMVGRASSLSFGIMAELLQPGHGEVGETASLELRALAPFIQQQQQQQGQTAPPGRLRQAVTEYVSTSMATHSDSAVRAAVAALPRFLSVNASERSDGRAAAVESAVAVLRALGQTEQAAFAEFLGRRLSRAKPRHRLVAVDLALALLSGVPGAFRMPWADLCVGVLCERCNDKIPGVRARAVANLAAAFDLPRGDEERRCLKDLLGFGASGGRDVAGIVRIRCRDERAAVRKGAIMLMSKVCSLLCSPPDAVMLQAMGAACSDPMVSIKKTALSALSETLREFPEERVVCEWAQSVPPLVMDNECSIQEDCLKFFEELVCNRISSVACSAKLKQLPVSSSSASLEQELQEVFPQGVLPLLKALSEGNIGNCVKRICAIMGKQKLFKPALVSALKNIISVSESLSLMRSIPASRVVAPAGSWFLLAEISVFVPGAVGWSFIEHHWRLLDGSQNTTEDAPATPYHSPAPPTGKDRPHRSTCDEQEEPLSVGWGADRVHLLQTIANAATVLDTDSAADLAGDLLERLKAFNMHPTEVGAHVKALVTLCKRQATTHEEGDKIVAAWASDLLRKAENVIDEYMSQFSTDDRKDSNFQTPQPERKARSRTRKTPHGSADACSLSIRVVTAVFTVGAVVLVFPSAKLGRTVTLLQTMVTSKSTDTQGKRFKRISLLSSQIAPTLYTQAWVALGKICLADEKTAKSSIPLFVRELDNTDSPAVRNNIMVAMTDFCVRYTALVDGFIPILTKSLRDPCEIVRRQTFIVLSRLLQRDYVKWRGILFHRFLLALVDESEQIRQLADYLFGTILKTKAPLLAYNSFVEAIFVLNDCQAPTGHIEALKASENERHTFSLRGNDEKVSSQRMHIYVALLKQMQPEHILATTAKLCAEILAVAADCLLNLDDPNSKCVLQDVLQILASKEMRLHGSRGLAASDNADLEEEGGAAAAFAVAKGRAVTHIAKKNLVQNSIPIFIELKRLLESKNSPLTGCLMDCLRTILKDLKNELDEILVGDKQLRKEILYDIQKHESVKAKSVNAETSETPENIPCNVSAARKNNHSEGDLQSAHAVARTNRKDKENIGAKIGQLHGKMSALKRKNILLPTVEKSASRVGTINSRKSANENAGAHSQVPCSSIPPVSSSLNVNSLATPKSVRPNNRRVIFSPQSQSIRSKKRHRATNHTAGPLNKDGASGFLSPLKSMSIPKLKHAVPSTVKTRNV